MLSFLASLILTPSMPPALQVRAKAGQAATKKVVAKPVALKAGESSILQGKDVAGPVTLKFQLSSPVRYVATSTRRIAGSQADIVASLKNYGFKQDGTEWVRSRRWGVICNPSTSGFEAVPGPVPAQAILRFRRESFAMGTSNDWSGLFLENGAKIIQRGNSEQVHVGDSFWRLNGIYGSTPQYETRYYKTNKAGEASLPEEPFKMPDKVVIGDSIPVSVDDANATLPAIWRISEIKEQDDTVYVAGRLKPTPGSDVSIEGTMVVRADLGVVDRLRVKFSYPDGKWQSIGHGPWTYSLEYKLVPNSLYDKFKEEEIHSFDAMGSASPLFDVDIATYRIRYFASGYKIANSPWMLTASMDGTCRLMHGEDLIKGTWVVAHRHLMFKPDMVLDDLPIAFSFKLDSDFLEPVNGIASFAETVAALPKSFNQFKVATTGWNLRIDANRQFRLTHDDDLVTGTWSIDNRQLDLKPSFDQDKILSFVLNEGFNIIEPVTGTLVFNRMVTELPKTYDAAYLVGPNGVITDLSVKKGDEIIISAEGQIEFASGLKSDPEGNDVGVVYPIQSYWRGAKYGSLIGQIGDDYFFIGKGGTFKAPASGNLTLLANAAVAKTKSGKYAVHVVARKS